MIHILKNNPELSANYAQTVAKAIEFYGKKYKLSTRLLSAIFMQESRYKVSAKNKRCGIDDSDETIKCVVQDYGLGQINYKTIHDLKLDKARLLQDVGYSVEAACIVLSDFKRRYQHREIDYWTRYNASTPSKRLAYKQLVSQYL